jgi:hypothetical protein
MQCKRNNCFKRIDMIIELRRKILKKKTKASKAVINISGLLHGG